MAQAEQVSCIDAFSPAHAESMEFSFDTNVDAWKSDSMSKTRPAHTATSSISFPPLTAATTPSAVLGSPIITDSNQGLRPTSQPSAQHASLGASIESIMENVQAAGFDSFDALVSAYYCDTFAESSPLANEQRLSRNRRLPKVIDDVFRATEGWSSWERRGFHEEILKTAESMLTSEGAGARSSLMSKITPLLESHDASNPAATAEALVNLKRSIQNEVSKPAANALHMSIRLLTSHSYPTHGLSQWLLRPTPATHGRETGRTQHSQRLSSSTLRGGYPTTSCCRSLVHVSKRSRTSLEQAAFPPTLPLGCVSIGTLPER